MKYGNPYCVRFKILIFDMKANHNKDYSVVKTFKAGQLAFFILKTLAPSESKSFVSHVLGQPSYATQVDLPFALFEF